MESVQETKVDLKEILMPFNEFQLTLQSQREPAPSLKQIPNQKTEEAKLPKPEVNQK